MSWWARYLRGSDATHVIPGLLMGAEPSRRGARALARAGVTHAVDLRSQGEVVTVWPDEVSTHRYPLREYEAPGVDQLHEIGSNVARLIQQGEVVYVHCRAGIQRAPLVACASLMRMGWSLPDAFRMVGSQRAVTAMSEDQLTVLRKLEVEMTRRTSVDSSTL